MIFKGVQGEATVNVGMTVADGIASVGVSTGLAVGLDATI